MSSGFLEMVSTSTISTSYHLSSMNSMNSIGLYIMFSILIRFLSPFFFFKGSLVFSERIKNWNGAKVQSSNHTKHESRINEACVYKTLSRSVLEVSVKVIHTLNQLFAFSGTGWKSYLLSKQYRRDLANQGCMIIISLLNYFRG